VLVDCGILRSPLPILSSSVDFWWYIPRKELAVIKDLSALVG